MNKRLFTKAVATMLGASLAVSGVPALALAAEGGAQTGDAAVTAPAEKTAYGASVTASVTSATTVTFAGYSGWKNKRGEGAAMANPTVTITSGDTTFAQDAAIGEGGAVTLSAPVAVGSYTAVISSDNYNDVTASFDYPALTDVAIGGAAYQYLDASKALSLVDEAAQAEALKEFTQIGQTSVYYKLKAGSTALAGTLYGMDMSKTTKYADLYQGMGAVNATAENFDAISSATQYTSHHAGDISALVDIAGADGAKAIVGTHNVAATVADAKGYVEAFILNAAGQELTAAQKELLNVRLNGNAMVNPATVTDRVAVDMAAASFSTGYTFFTQYLSNPAKHYGNTKITVRPKAGSETSNFTWADYYASMYAATLEDAKGNVYGMAPWIDLYAEGGHGAVEISLVNGVNKYADNGATVNRYAALYDAKTGRLKAGTYTVKIYAAGYNTLEYTFNAPGVGITSDFMNVDLSDVDLSAMTNPTVSVKRVVTVDSAEGDVEDTSFAQDVAPVGGLVALTKEAVDGDYQVDVKNNADPDNPVTTSYTFTLDTAAYRAAEEAEKPAVVQQAQKITLGTKKKTYGAKAVKKAKKTFKIGAKAKTKLSYSVTKKVKKAGVSVSSAGMVTVKKGTKKGTYKVAVKAAATSAYKAASATVTVKIK